MSNRPARRNVGIVAGAAVMALSSTPVVGQSAAQSPPTKHVVPSTPGDRALGEYLSGECVTCHQLSGAYKGIPPIVGWPVESFIEIMNAYKTRARDNEVMRNIAVKFTDEEVAALAAYFGSLKPKS